MEQTTLRSRQWKPRSLAAACRLKTFFCAEKARAAGKNVQEIRVTCAS
jgi:hypothetical protein